MAMFRHLEEVQMTYREHLWFALKLAGRLVWGALTCAVHALLPCFFTEAATDTMHALKDALDR